MTLVAKSGQAIHLELDSLAEIDWDFPERVSHSSIELVSPVRSAFLMAPQSARSLEADPKRDDSLTPREVQTASLDDEVGSRIGLKG